MPIRLCWVAVVLLAATTVSATRAADLKVEVRGVRVRGGDVHVAVFDRAEDFRLDIEVRAMVSRSGEISAGIFTDQDQIPRPPADSLSVYPSANRLSVVFPNLEPGEFAVVAYQDRNSNRRLDATIARIPLEPWGISNDPRPERRAPTWDEAKFALRPAGTRVVIELSALGHGGGF